MGSWTRKEIEITVADYLDMLEAELAGIEYNKTKHRQAISSLLKERTETAIEWKHQNISAILAKHGLPYISGYKPKGNFQILLQEILLKEIGHRNIPPSLQRRQEYPFHVFSWEVVSPNVALKTMDKSVFLHDGTSIPKEITSFFRYELILEPKEITFIHEGLCHLATLTPDVANQRVRLFWRGDFSKVIADNFQQYLQMYLNNIEPPEPFPEIRFERNENSTDDTYLVSLINPEQISSDNYCTDENVALKINCCEGDSKQQVTTYYERNPQNRLAAIRIHGYRCVVCGFDFCEVYGKLGKNYIEVHHIVPLSELKVAHDVNPVTDLVPVCANCHRIIHRKRERPVDIIALKEIIKKH